jgi:hypothetical protein
VISVVLRVLNFQTLLAAANRGAYLHFNYINFVIVVIITVCSLYVKLYL